MNRGRKQKLKNAVTGKTADLRKKLWAVSNRHHCAFTAGKLLSLSKELGIDLRGAGIAITYDNMTSYIRKFDSSAPNDTDTSKNSGLIRFLKAAITEISALPDESILNLPFEEVFKNTELIKNYEAFTREDGTQISNDPDIPMYSDPDKINPDDVEAVSRSSGNASLSQKLMYYAPAAVKLWNSVASDPNYGLYRICESNLTKLLSKPDWQNVIDQLGTILILGAGAASKDNKIIQSLGHPLTKEIRLLWMDVSPLMLVDTIGKVRAACKKATPALKACAIATDFEDSRRVKYWTENYGGPEEEIRATFILGFTLSNIDEENFFARFSEVSREGDLLIIPMEFVPDDSLKETEFLKRFEERYSSPLAIGLARAAFAIMPDVHIGDRTEVKSTPIHFNKKMKSHKLEFKTFQGGRFITTATATRHPRNVYIDFLEQHGFKYVDSEEDKDHGVETLLLKFSRPY